MQSDGRPEILTAHMRQAVAMTSTVVSRDPEVLRGTPVFLGTRVPIKILFDHLEAGDSLEVFLDDFPSVSREQAVKLLEDARSAVADDNEAAA